MKVYFIIILIAFSIFSVSAQGIFSPPFPIITIRDSVSKTQYSAQLVGYDLHTGNPLESDGGLQPFEAGSNLIFSSLSSTTVQYSDMNIATGLNTDILEFVSGNYEILLPNGQWFSGNGITMAVILSANNANLGNEDGLGSPAYATLILPTFYSNYFNRYGLLIGNNRLYGAPFVMTSIQTTIPLTLPTGEIFDPYFDAADLEDNILAFAINYPMNTLTMTSQPMGAGGCVSLSYPAYITTPLFSNGLTCYYFNQYIGYFDLSAGSPSTEGTFLPIAGSPNTLSSSPGIYENNPSVSRNPNAPSGEYLIARESNMFLPATSFFDIFIYNTSSASDIAVIPENSSGSAQNQFLPSFDYPFISFLELPSSVYPGSNAPFQPADLHLYNIATNTRTTTPIVISVNYYAKLAYDYNSGSGIIAYVPYIYPGGALQTIRYVLLNYGGVSSTPVSISLPPNIQLFRPNAISITSNNGNHFIYYLAYPIGSLSTPFIYRYNVQTAIHELLYADQNMFSVQTFQFNPAIYVSGDNSFVSLRIQPQQGGFLSSLLINVDTNNLCLFPPCYIYELGDAGRLMNNAAPIFTQANQQIILDNNNPTSNYAGLFSGNFRASPIGRLDISNL